MIGGEKRTARRPRSEHLKDAAKLMKTAHRQANQHGVDENQMAVLAFLSAIAVELTTIREILEEVTS